MTTSKTTSQPSIADVQGSADSRAIPINKVGIKDCGCKKRQAALNRAGQYLGLPPGQQS